MKNRDGFSLVEMVVVIGLILLLLVVALPSIGRMRVESSLSQAAETVSLQFQLAHQQALAKGVIAEVRFMERDGAWFAIQTLVLQSDGTRVPLTPIEAFPQGIELEPSTKASPLLALMETGTMPTPQHGTVTWRGLRFMPSGETLGAENTLLTPETSYLTLMPSASLQAGRPAEAAMPGNYATLQITPATSQVMIYRP